jgi:hypothetical protein
MLSIPGHSTAATYYGRATCPAQSSLAGATMRRTIAAAARDLPVNMIERFRRRLKPSLHSLQVHIPGTQALTRMKGNESRIPFAGSCRAPLAGESEPMIQFDECPIRVIFRRPFFPLPLGWEILLRPVGQCDFDRLHHPPPKKVHSNAFAQEPCLPSAQPNWKPYSAGARPFEGCRALHPLHEVTARPEGAYRVSRFRAARFDLAGHPWSTGAEHLNEPFSTGVLQRSMT